MRRTTLSNVLRNAGLAALASLAIVGTSNAVVYRTIWDPILDPSYSQTLGWTGSGEVSLAASCLAGPAGVKVVSSLECGPVTLTSFSLAFYDPYSPPPDPPGTLIDSTGGPFATSQSVFRISVDGSGGLTGVELFGSFFAGIFDLLDDSVIAQLNFVIGSEFVGPTLQLYSNCDGDSCSLLATSATSGDNAPNDLAWTLVPEPASLALVGAALAALGLGRHRKT